MSCRCGDQVEKKKVNIGVEEEEGRNYGVGVWDPFLIQEFGWYNHVEFL